MTKKNDEKEMTFEESLEQLSELVKKLEAGDLNLDESIKVYEEAIVLRDRCRKFLDESERKVQKLMDTAQGAKKESFDIDRTG